MYDIYYSYTLNKGEYLNIGYLQELQINYFKTVYLHTLIKYIS